MPDERGIDMNAPMTLAQVLPSWIQAKEEERKAIEMRRSLDKMIQDLLPKKDEGSITETNGDFKVSVTYKLDRKIDTEKLQESWGHLPMSAQCAIKWKADLSTSVFRTLADSDKAALAKYITTKPASPSVMVEFIKE
jgi:hypothetical protein